MSVLKILKYPDYRLRKIAKPISNINSDIHKIIKDMFDTMYFYNGIGLAATQVNIPLQIIVMDVILESTNPITLINPKIIKKHGTIITQEGCLSIPYYQEKITRAKEITVDAFNSTGKKIKIHTKENFTLSICIQHEIDHLLGKLFIDHLSDLKKKRFIKKINKKKYDS
ncbi:MAG: peptide deformylase [Buchnera aphidicola (Chaetogeoica yunlongensis)]